MLTKTKIVIAATLILGTASAALAEGSDRYDAGGGPTQTWQDVEQSRQNIQNQIQSQYHMGSPGNAYGYVVQPRQTHRASHEQNKNR